MNGNNLSNAQRTYHKENNHTQVQIHLKLIRRQSRVHTDTSLSDSACRLLKLTKYNPATSLIHSHKLRGSMFHFRVEFYKIMNFLRCCQSYTGERKRNYQSCVNVSNPRNNQNTYSPIEIGPDSSKFNTSTSSNI